VFLMVVLVFNPVMGFVVEFFEGSKLKVLN